MNSEAAKSLWQKIRPFALTAWLCFFVLLCLTGLNPYFRPDYHDNITYYVAAQSMLAGEGYTFQGAPIADWPPVTSLVLAAVFSIFGASIFAAKLVSIAAAVLTVILANRLLRREQRSDRLKTIALFTLTPVALLTATTVASDWICAVFSFGCLLTLWHLRQRRGFPLAIATGLLLGLAALTRQTGVLLGAAILAQAFYLYRKLGWRSIIPECLAAAIGASMYLAWGAYVATQLAKHPALTGNYVTHGLELFTDFSLAELAISVFDLFWKWDDVLEKLGVPSGIAVALLILPSLILLTGIGSLVRRRTLHPSDIYAIAFLALLFGYHWKMSRYLLPVAPILLAWFFVGLRQITGMLSGCLSAKQMSPDRLVPAIATLWLIGLIPLNAYVLFNRAGNGAHRGISVISSPAPADYYQDRWAELYAACDAIRKDGHPGAIASSGFYLRYVKAFSKRLAIDNDNGRPSDPAVAYTIFVADEDGPITDAAALPSDIKIFETRQVTVFRHVAATAKWSGG